MGKFIRDFDESVDASSIDDFFKPFSASRDTFAARKGAYIPEDIVGLWQQIKMPLQGYTNGRPVPGMTRI